MRTVQQFYLADLNLSFRAQLKLGAPTVDESMNGRDLCTVDGLAKTEKKERLSRLKSITLMLVLVTRDDLDCTLVLHQVGFLLENALGGATAAREILCSEILRSCTEFTTGRDVPL